MIRRSTLVFLTCLAALGTSAVRTPALQSPAAQNPVAQNPVAQNKSAALQYSSSSQMLVAQASGGTPSSELSINSRGEAVKALQVRLQKNSYYSAPIDGLYGLATQRAVRDFQADANLSQTGSLDEKTWQQLQALSNTGSPSANAGENAANKVALVAEATSAPGTVAQAAPGTVAQAAPETAPETVAQAAPTASELPPIDIDKADGEPAVDVEPERKAGGSGKTLGIGVGVIAVLASFGVGFYLANRDKSSGLDEGGWGEIEPSTNLTLAKRATTPIAPAMGRQQKGSSVVDNGTFNRPASGQVNNGHVSSPMSGGGGGAISQNSAISSMSQSSSHALSTSGQMGNAAPLTQVDIIDGLVGDLRNPDPARRRKAIWELGQRGNSLAMQPLVDSMIDADSKEKSLVLAALSEIGIRSLKPMSRALAIALQDDNPEVRKNAIRDLTRVYDLVVQISQMLGHATEDEDPEVRQTATWALEQLNRIRRSQDVDANVRTFSSGSTVPPIDLLSSEASLRRSQQGLS